MLTQWSQVATRGSCGPFLLHVTFWAWATPAGHSVLLQRPHIKPVFPAPKELKTNIPLGVVSTPPVCVAAPRVLIDFNMSRDREWVSGDSRRLSPRGLSWILWAIEMRKRWTLILSLRERQPRDAHVWGRFTTLHDANSHKWSIIRMNLCSPFYSDACSWETSVFTVSSSQKYSPM